MKKRSLTTETDGPSLEEIDAELARRSLAEFVRQGWHVLDPGTSLDWNWHIEVLCDHLQALIEDWMARQNDEAFQQRIQNLLINVPPGTAKSRIVSVFLPAWVWLHWPSWKAFFLSVNPRVALRDSVLCREVLRSRWYQERFRPEWEFSEDQDAKGLFKNTMGGWRSATGFGAQIVGDRGDALIIDDPNDPEEVHSEVSRNNVNTRYEDVLQNRLNDLRCSVRVIIQQRVHVDDLTGYVLRQQPDRWEHLRIPMEAEDTTGCECQSCARGETVIGWRDTRAPGDLMFPKRFPEWVLIPFRAKSYLWTSQYQQRPVSAVGNLFRPSWWRYWRFEDEPEVPELAHRTVVISERRNWCIEFGAAYQSLDAAFKKTKDSDLIASGAWACLGPKKYLLDLRWKKMDFIETCAAVKEQRLWLEALGLTVRATLVEDKANGSAVVTTMRTEFAAVVEVDPEGGKEARAYAISPQVEAGDIFIPLHAEWRERFVAEHTAFPKGANDDAVDQLTQFLNWLNANAGNADDVPEAPHAAEPTGIRAVRM